ncbi:CinA family protein [Chryseobacterium wangxinyae]|uniref:CinA family protein n=1 Tax=Chryseobacterium sp. CY350 TaxID=2997336 RepID=UPI00226DDA37|nr:CinA family protein [Chryseobacterium sp. CY350]MCY0976930.1 CinA family protein [Chryseobacterium sp. CY350]WBZ96930.1 CinA family protein [Chryseobacterium sp. CY350]
MDLNQYLLDEISGHFMCNSETISIAESVTGGLLQLAFSEMPNSKLFYKGGITVHTPEKIVNLLKVNVAEIKNCNCVSSFVAETMGRHACNLFESQWCIATSGYCVPERSSSYEIYAYYSISHKGKVIYSDRLESSEKLDSLAIKLYYTEEILEKFLGQLKLMRILKNEITD